MFTSNPFSAAKRALSIGVLSALPVFVVAAPLATDVGGLDLTANPDVFLSTVVPHATVQGRLDDAAGTAWFRFNGTSGDVVMLDVDNDGSTFTDSTLALFSSDGELLAFADDSFPADPGSGTNPDAFIGTFVLPYSGAFYVALASYANFPNLMDCDGTVLLRPDGESGGVATTGCSDRSFTIGSSDGNSTGSYTLHISVGPLPSPVPSPGSLALVGLGLFVAGAARRR